MPGPPILAQVRLKSMSGFPRDDVINDFVFNRADDFSAGEADAVQADLEDFYNLNFPATGNPIAFYIGGQMSRATNAAEVNYYDLTGHLNGSPHGSPVETRNFTLGAQGGGSNLPEELAAVLSIHGDLTDVPERLGDTRPAARRRGRIFIGPLKTIAFGTAAGLERVRILQAVMDSMVQAADHLQNQQPSWSVWSRAAAALYEVTGGFVDDAPDTQRRRGQIAGTRTLWTA